MGSSASKTDKEAEAPKPTTEEAGAKAEATAPAAEKKTPKLYLLEKQNPSFGWKKRYFLVDELRGALVYHADEARTKFKGAVPLSLVSNVLATERQLVLEIPGRRFVLRPTKGADEADLKSLTTTLLDAIAMEPEAEADGKASADHPAGHWKQQERYTSRPLREEGNTLSRAQHPGYPARTKLLSGTQSWDVALPTYAPPTFTAAATTVTPVADGCVSWTGKMKSAGGQPLNPSGRTGLAGQGELLRSGPNQEVRAIVTREDAGTLYVVAVRKAAAQEWTLPGGFLPPSSAGARPPTAKTMKHAFAMQAAAAPSDKNGARLEAIFVESPAAETPVTTAAVTAVVTPAVTTVAEAAAAEAAVTEASSDAAAQPTAARPAWLVHLGYCDHSANTDNAWLESAVGHFHCGAQEGADLLLGEGAGLKDARWIKVPLGAAAGGNPGFWSELRPAHHQWVRTALLRRGAYAAKA